MPSSHKTDPSVFSNRNFSLLFGGSSVSAVGDQFTLVALPWLVLKLTGNPAALGFVLAAIALPRAVFMLIGGAVVDRFSPRLVLLQARAVNAVCIVALTALVVTGVVNMWMVYLLALGIGLSTAFAYPAGSAILPQLVEVEQLRAANALIMAMRQISLIVGPVLAGFVIALGAHKVSAGHLTDAHGMALAFSIDAGSFLLSLASLLIIRTTNDFNPPKISGGVLTSVMDGIRKLWKDVPLRAFVLYIAVVSIFVGGPLQVGLPMLADTRLDMGAASLGILMTASGIGMLFGSLFSGLSARLVRGRLGIMVLSFDCISGFALASLAMTHTTTSAALLLAFIGILGGMVQVAVFTWIQQRVSQEMMGRIMSIIMFALMGLAPISAAIAGTLLQVISLTALFSIAGMALTAIAVACLRSRQLRSIRFVPPQSAEQQPDPAGW